MRRKLVGLGAAVCQSVKKVGYASRTLTFTEKGYAQIEKELLSIVFACTRFDQILVGNNKIIVKTDHRPLIDTFKKPLLKASKRLQLMLIILRRYRLEVNFVKGNDNVVADTLSMAPISVTKNREHYDHEIYEIIKEEMLRNEIEKIDMKENLNVSTENTRDTSLQQLINYIRYGWPKHYTDVVEPCKIYYKYKDELAIQDNIIYSHDRILIPFDFRQDMINRVHVAHSGIKGTINVDSHCLDLECQHK
jgi:hypothetical protein